VAKPPPPRSGLVCAGGGAGGRPGASHVLSAPAVCQLPAAGVGARGVVAFARGTARARDLAAATGFRALGQPAWRLAGGAGGRRRLLDRCGSALDWRPPDRTECRSCEAAASR